MDMLSFFQTIIPSDGFKFLMEVRKNGSMAHYPFDDFDAMVDKAEELTAAGVGFYHACSSYKEVRYNEYDFAIGRAKDNVKLVKALWQDLDVGKLDQEGNLKPDNYATKKDAAQAIADMMKAVGMPKPLLVDSGSGYHCYWPFIEAIPAEEWLVIARLARAAMRHVGFKSDASRDLDEASVLRPPGSFNKGDPVVVMREQECKSHLYYKELLQLYVDKHKLLVPTPTVVLENEFAGPPKEFPPSSLEIVATRCNQIKIFKDTGGMSEPLWRLALGLAKHCTNGAEVAHEWSKQYDGYDKDETQGKIDRWQTGPTTCERFKAENPTGCDGCIHASKVKSPIQLGYTEDTVAPVIEAPDDGKEPSAPVPIPHWPNNFRTNGYGVIEMMVPDKDDVPQPVTVAQPLFYFTERIKTEDGTFAYTVRMNVKGGPSGEWRDFPLPAKMLSDIKGLKMILSSHEIVVHNDKLMSNFVNQYAINLRQRVAEVNTFKQFGWTSDFNGLLVGTSLVTKDGRKEVRVSDSIIRDPVVMAAGVVKGTKEEWTEGVDTLYNREHGAPWQYAICTQLASVLVPLLGREEWNGIPLVLTSDDSGYGKSTCVKIGINALCDSTKTTVSGTTPNAIIGRASVMNHLPLLVDETTRMLPDPKDLSMVCYALSNGRSKIGMQSDGKERIPLPPFKLGATFTSNKSMRGTLAEDKQNPEASQLRLFEIEMDQYPRMDSLALNSTIHGEHQALANHLVDNVHGVWADDFIGFVITHRDEVRAKLHEIALAIITKMGGFAAKERFYAYHLTGVLVAAWIARKIKMIRFELKTIREFGMEHIERMRLTAGEYGASVEDRLSQLLADSHGTILVTKNYDALDTKIGKTEMPLIPLRGGVTARLVIGDEKERGKLYLSVAAIDSWCAKKSIAAVNFRKQLANAGLLRAGGDQGKGYDRKVSLSKGVPSVPAGRCRCVEVEYAQAQGYVEEHVGLANVVQISGSLPSSTPSSSQPSTGASEA